ncbi:hypothetical protein M3612_25000 [Niallia taxi]|uniref:hypothetical protein n=1 Tax=Niallia taxi TaxID=2499688 RepID=UPI002041D085|nr:hypothetical protein [Niallia taxi]MCM3217731.1 hypothetical protein [Niallia taxi]
MNKDIVSEMTLLSKLDSSKRIELLATIKELQKNPRNKDLKETIIHLNKELQEISDIRKEHWFVYKEISISKECS